MRTRLRTEALLVRSAAFGDADVMVTFFTEARGIVSAVARSARRSQRRFPALEPMHTLRVGLEERASSDVLSLAESAIVRPRLRILQSLEKLDAAGQALRWVRRAAPPHTPEPALWQEINALLDRLDDPDTASSPAASLAGTGLRLLSAIGWGLQLSRCIRCGRPCEVDAAGCLDPAQGGLVCRACGGARILLRGERRAKLLAATLGEDPRLSEDDARAAMEIVEAALVAHAS